MVASTNRGQVISCNLHARCPLKLAHYSLVKTASTDSLTASDPTQPITALTDTRLPSLSLNCLTNSSRGSDQATASSEIIKLVTTSEPNGVGSSISGHSSTPHEPDCCQIASVPVSTENTLAASSNPSISSCRSIQKSGQKMTSSRAETALRKSANVRKP